MREIMQNIDSLLSINEINDGPKKWCMAQRTAAVVNKEYPHSESS